MVFGFLSLTKTVPTLSASNCLDTKNGGTAKNTTSFANCLTDPSLANNLPLDFLHGTCSALVDSSA